MNIEKSKNCYPHGTDAVFVSVPAKLGRLLVIHGIKRESFKMNNVEYVFKHYSYNWDFESLSIYYTARGRLYRVSCHWCNERTGGTTACPHMGKNHWFLKGTNNGFYVSQKDIDVRGRRRYYDYVAPDLKNKDFEAGYCLLRNFHFTVED